MSLFHWLSCVSEAYDMILLPVCPDISPQKSKIKECGPNMTDAEVLPSPVVDLEPRWIRILCWSGSTQFKKRKKGWTKIHHFNSDFSCHIFVYFKQNSFQRINCISGYKYSYNKFGSTKKCWQIYFKNLRNLYWAFIPFLN